VDVRRFGGVGQLSIDEVFSPQQAVLDREILAYVERVLAGLDLAPPDTDTLGLVREGMGEGSFVAATDTVLRFREFYHFPDIFRHWKVERWRAAGEPSVLGEAWSRAQEEIAASTFRLTEDKQREVDSIYERAKRYVQSRR